MPISDTRIKAEDWIRRIAWIGKHDNPCAVASEAAGIMRMLLDELVAAGHGVTYLECPCCGDNGAASDGQGCFYDGQPLICGCPGWVSVDADGSECPWINNSDAPCKRCEPVEANSDVPCSERIVVRDKGAWRFDP